MITKEDIKNLLTDVKYVFQTICGIVFFLALTIILLFLGLGGFFIFQTPVVAGVCTFLFWIVLLAIMIHKDEGDMD